MGVSELPAETSCVTVAGQQRTRDGRSMAEERTSLLGEVDAAVVLSLTAMEERRELVEELWGLVSYMRRRMQRRAGMRVHRPTSSLLMCLSAMVVEG